MMSHETILMIPKVIEKYQLTTLDITGGAPEIHPYFEDLILMSRSHNVEIIDRCNLTILREEGYEHLTHFLAENKIKVVSCI